MNTIKKTILIADDEEDLRLLVEVTLENIHNRILTAADGHDALTRIKLEQPDLVILDWMMPGLTGPDVIRHLRQDPTTKNIPVMLLTAKDQQEDFAEAGELGIFAYLVKPFSPLELLQKVQEALGS